MLFASKKLLVGVEGQDVGECTVGIAFTLNVNGYATFASRQTQAR
jgi:hypothetical protein